MRNSQLPLFPDLLERSDPFGHFADHLQRGFGIWGFEDGSTTRKRSEACYEHRHLFVVYDDQRRRIDKTGQFWTVEIRHYFNTHEQKGRQHHMRQTVRYFERHVETREAAIVLAERLLSRFASLRRRETPEAIMVEEFPEVVHG
jgi:hypothetical protein